MKNVIVNENNVGYLKLYADDFKNYDVFKQYWDTPNVESFEDDQVLMYRTFDLEKVKNTVWLLEDYDIWFSNDSRRIHGIFSSREKALEAVGYGTDGWNKDYYENGTDQWKSDTLEIGIMVREVELDEFGEV